MKKSEKEFLKHFTIIILLICGTMIIPHYYVMPCWLEQTLVAVAFIYMLLFLMGIFINVGPFKYVVELYIYETKLEHEERRPKKPWE